MMRPPPGGTFPHSVRCSAPQKESTSSALRGRIGGIGPSGASAGGGGRAVPAAGGGASPSPMAITALRQGGDNAAALACRQRKAAEPPGFHARAMHAEIGAACGADGGDLWRWRLLAFGGRRSRRRRSSRLRRGGGRLGGCRRRRRRCGGWRRRRWCRSRWCRLRRRRALCRRRSNGVERRLARRRYFGGIALETFERVFSARLHAGALRHEVGAAGGADRRNLLGRRLLGRGRQRSPNHEPGRNQQAHSAPTAELHASLPFCRAARCTIGRVPSSMRCIAVARRLCDAGLVC